MPDVHFFSFGDGRYPMWTVECFRWGNPCPLGHATTYVDVIPFEGVVVVVLGFFA
jgi:hypothetical protein